MMNKQKMEEDVMPSMALKAEEEMEEEVMNTMFKYKNDELENNSRRRWIFFNTLFLIKLFLNQETT